MNDSNEESQNALGGARWRKATFSATAECVIVAEIETEMALRNSNHPGAGTLLFPMGALAAWIAGCKAGEFDHLTG